MITDEQRLRTAGLRATRPRLAVLAALRELGGHRGADEVLARLQADGEPAAASPAPTRASVYNVLRDLTAAGLVLTADAGPGAVLYEVGDTFHHHFVCRVCGEITDVECVVGARPCLDPGPALTEIAEVDEAQVIFRGRCRRCAQAAPPSDIVL